MVMDDIKLTEDGSRPNLTGLGSGSGGQSEIRAAREEDNPLNPMNGESMQPLDIELPRDGALNSDDSPGFRIRDCMSFVGPGFLMAIAYVDPGNFEVDMQAGAQFGESLLWVLLVSTLAGLLVQILCVRLAASTEFHLARLCRHEYSTWQSRALWLLTEVAIVASDIPEVIGTAFALKMLFGLTLWIGIVLTSVSAMLFLMIQSFGARILEAFFALLVAMISACFIAELHFARHSINGLDAVLGLISFGKLAHPINVSSYIAVSMFGALVMPHNLFLHSALIIEREGGTKKNNEDNSNPNAEGAHDHTAEQNLEDSGLLNSSVKSAAVSTKNVGPKATKLIVIYSGLESAFALAVSLFINVAVVLVASTTAESLSGEEKQHLIDNPLQNAPSMLQNVLGDKAKIFFGLALLASGFSSTMTGTLAGQYVMEGFINFRIHPFARALITRATAIVPSLIVTLVVGESGAEQLIVLSSVILSFELPFALIPLIKFVCSEKMMGSMAVKGLQKFIALAISVLVIAANLFMLGSTVASTAKTQPGARGIVFIVAMAILGVVYLAVLYMLLRRKVRQSLQELNPKRYQQIAPQPAAPTL